MRIRWRGLELPSRVLSDAELNTDYYGKFVVEPFERGLGTTVGNSLRRILLSTIEGSAVTKVRIAHAEHEFSSLTGVQEDVTDIILNIKNLVVAMDSDEPKTMTLSAAGPGEVTADLIEADTSITILNKDLVLCNLTEAVDFDVEFIVERGRGYVPASELQERAEEEEQELGWIHVDAIFSPVLRVRYKVEDTRVGQKTNYDKLTMEIWTNGAVAPEMAMVEAAKVLRKHLNPFVQYYELGPEQITAEAKASIAIDEELIGKLQMPLEDLELSVRASNCLEASNVQFVGQLASLTEAELLTMRAFGKTSLKEVKRKLEDMGLSLGMEMPEGVEFEQVVIEKEEEGAEGEPLDEEMENEDIVGPEEEEETEEQA